MVKCSFNIYEESVKGKKAGVSKQRETVGIWVVRSLTGKDGNSG